MQKQEAEKLAALEKEEADLTYSFNSPSDDRDFHPATTAGPTQIDALRAAITSLNATTIKLGREIDELTKLRNFVTAY